MPSQPNFEQDPMDLRDLIEQVEDIYYQLYDREDIDQCFTLADHKNLTPGSFEETVEAVYSPTFDDELEATLVISSGSGVAAYAAAQSLGSGRDWSGFENILRETSTTCALIFSIAALTYGVRYAVNRYRAIDKSL